MCSFVEFHGGGQVLETAATGGLPTRRRMPSCPTGKEHVHPVTDLAPIGATRQRPGDASILRWLLRVVDYTPRLRCFPSANSCGSRHRVRRAWLSTRFSPPPARSRE